jgi:hypothetical protein
MMMGGDLVGGGGEWRVAPTRQSIMHDAYTMEYEICMECVAESDSRSELLNHDCLLPTCSTYI